MPALPPVLAALAAGAALWRRSPPLVLVALAALTSVLGVRALEGLDDPPTGPIDGWVTLLDDPRPVSSGGARGVMVTARHERARIAVRAYGATAGRLDDTLAGERVQVVGTLKPTTRDWHRWRHVAATVTVSEVGDTAPASPLLAFTNRIRRLLADGAQSMSTDHRALFGGMVYGDDREQSPRLADDFRAAGLGHLLVVSGQNVAFVLALAAPLAMRLRPAGRLLVLFGVLAVFAVLTRFEPSVLRAVAMAALAVGSAALGNPARGRATLAWAVAGVLVVDPFLVHSLAFQLSVCATAGILWITPPLSEAMRGPRAFRLAFATTAGAQVGVMPLLVAVFGTVPLASLPANLLAGPASGPVMMWGLTAGLAAGALEALADGWFAWLIHRPTALLLWWVRGVAGAAAVAPPAVLGAAASALVALGVALVVVSRRLPSQSQARRPSAVAATVLVGAVFAYSVANAASAPAGWSTLDGVRVFADGSAYIAVLDKPRSPERMLESLRAAGVRRVDLVVASVGRAADAHAVVALLDRFPQAEVIGPPMHRVPRARTAPVGSVVCVGESAIEIVADSPQLAVVAGPCPPMTPPLYSPR